MALIKALRDIWDVKSEIAAAWVLVAQEINAELEQIGVPADDQLDTEAGTLGSLLETITVADLLNIYPRGFAVGSNAGVYEVVGTGDFDHKSGVGTLYVKPRVMPEITRDKPARTRRSAYGA